MDRSDRSRSPVGRSSFEETERLREAYRKIRTAKRGGKVHKRRLKSICARLLEHLIRLIDLVLQEFQFGTEDTGILVLRTIAIVSSKLQTDWKRFAKAGFHVGTSIFWSFLSTKNLNRSLHHQLH